MTLSFKMMPAAMIAVVLVPAVSVQLIVDRHVQIHDDPNSSERYDWYTPERTRHCNAR